MARSLKRILRIFNWIMDGEEGYKEQVRFHERSI